MDRAKRMKTEHAEVQRTAVLDGEAAFPPSHSQALQEVARYVEQNSVLGLWRRMHRD